MISYLNFLFCFQLFLDVLNFKNIPVILIPGLGGSRLRTKATHHVKPRDCPKTKHYTRNWLSNDSLHHSECLTAYLSMIYDEKSGKMVEKEETLSKVRKFGRIDEVTYLNFNKEEPIDYFSKITSFLVEKYFYRPGINLVGAPYDWRHITQADLMAQYFTKLKNLIVKTYDYTSDSPVILISHGMGSPLVTRFLIEQPLRWKEKYIWSYLSISGTFSGSIAAVGAIVHGNDYGLNIFKYSKTKLAEMQRTFVTSYYQFPSNISWNPVYPWAQTPDKIYTIKQIPQFLETHFPGSEKILNLNPELFALGDLGVKFGCAYSKGIPTVEYYNFTKDLKILNTRTIDGDGFTPVFGLKACRKYKGSVKGLMKFKQFKGFTPYTLITSQKLIDYVDDWIKYE